MMKIKTQPPTALVLLFSILTFSNPTLAMVNVREASYRQTWTDLDLSHLQDELKLTRTYSSRSRFIGALGYGWCLSFETQIANQKNGNLKLFDCENQTQLIYQKSPKSKDRRPEWIPAQGLFLRGTAERIFASSGFWRRQRANGQTQVFSQQTGRLLTWIDAHGRRMNLNYNADGRLQSVLVGKQLLLTFESIDAENPPGQKLFVHTSDKLVQYRSANLDLLDVSNWNNRLETLTYDDQHNLTSWSVDGVPREQIKYDREHDQVLTLLKASGCQQDFQYQADSQLRLRHVSTKERQRCPGQTPITVTHDFWYRQKANPTSVYLALYEVHRDQAVQKQFFSPDGTRREILQPHQP